jgi:hypothetical protein
MFTRMEKVPNFELISVGFGPVKDEDIHDEDKEKAMMRRDSFAELSVLERKQLWRKYKLGVADFECDILEVFPDRDMFIVGEDWLDLGADKEEYDAYTMTGVRFPRFVEGGVNSYLLVAVVFLLTLELWRFFAAHYSY